MELERPPSLIASVEFIHPNSGKIFFKGEEITYLKPYQVAKKGIARTFQNIELFSHMSTMDNLMLGRHLHMKTGVWRGATFIYKGSKAAKEEIKHREKVEEIIDFLELQVARNQFVINLPYGTRKLVELGRALALEPELILLDEPSAGMNMEEKGDLMFSIQDIRDDLGITVHPGGTRHELDHGRLRPNLGLELW